MFTVIYSDEFTEWILSLSKDERTSILAGMALLEEYGYQLKRPYADTITDSKFTNLKELRIQHAGNAYRAFFIFDPTRQAVVLCGGQKTNEKRFYKEMIPLAEKIYQRYLDNLANDGESN